MATSDDAYKAIGAAVANCQFLEFTFVLCVKLVFAHNDADKLSDIEPLNRKTFKAPTKALLDELRTHIDISPEFDAKLADAVERRHQLVHRWLLDHSWPEDGDRDGLARLTEFATHLSKDVIPLTYILIAAVHNWLKRFPEASENLPPLGNNWMSVLPEEYRTLKIEKA